MGEPLLVIVNFSGQQDPLSYVREGVAVGAYRPDEVEPAIRAAVLDPEIRARMSERRSAFLRRYATPDGVSATQQMVNLVLSLARNH